MPRKKHQTTTADNAPPSSPISEPTQGAVDSQSMQQNEQAAADLAESNESAPKNWGPPYKAIFTSNDKGFELGENRRFKQRVFTFRDRPDPDIIEKLKDSGFTYRAAEKSWTIEATAESRVLTDRLAREFAGPESAMGRE